MPQKAFAVAGPQYPANVEWPANVTWVPHLAPGDHAAFYCAQRFALNLTRADMRELGYSPSVRLFEAAACGVPIISDRWAGLETIFSPGREILLAGTTQEALRHLSETGEQQRNEIAAAARTRVLNEHTSMHRAKELENILRISARKIARTA